MTPVYNIENEQMFEKRKLQRINRRMKMKKKYVITSPLRFFLFIVIIVMIVSFSVYTIAGKASAYADSDEDNGTYKTVVVESGDSLWQIAAENSNGSVDLREVVYTICEINDITAGDIQPGEEILIPVN